VPNPIQSGHLPARSDDWKAKSLKLDYGILLTFPPEIALCVRQAARTWEQKGSTSTSTFTSAKCRPGDVNRNGNANRPEEATD